MTTIDTPDDARKALAQATEQVERYRERCQQLRAELDDATEAFGRWCGVQHYCREVLATVPGKHAAAMVTT